MSKFLLMVDNQSVFCYNTGTDNQTNFIQLSSI